MDCVWLNRRSHPELYSSAIPVICHFIVKQHVNRSDEITISYAAFGTAAMVSQDV